jgi:hypothetical protein
MFGMMINFEPTVTTAKRYVFSLFNKYYSTNKPPVLKKKRKKY